MSRVVRIAQRLGYHDFDGDDSRALDFIEDHLADVKSQLKVAQERLAAQGIHYAVLAPKYRIQTLCGQVILPAPLDVSVGYNPVKAGTEGERYTYELGKVTCPICLTKHATQSQEDSNGTSLHRPGHF